MGSLCSLASGSQPSQSSLVSLDVLLVLAFELVDKVVHHPVVKVFSTKMSVSSSGLDLKDALLDGQDRNIESSSSQVKDENIALSRSFLLVQSVGNCSSCRFIDYSEDVETSDNSSIFCGLSLRVVEICWNCDNGILDFSTKVSLGCLLHLGQNHGGALLGGKPLGLVLVLDLKLGSATLLDHGEGPVLHVSLDSGVIEFSTNESFSIKDGVGGVDCDLILGWISDQPLGVSECHIGGSCPVSLVIGNDLHFAMLKHSDTGVGGAQVNTNCLLLGHFVSMQ